MSLYSWLKNVWKLYCNCICSMTASFLYWIIHVFFSLLESTTKSRIFLALAQQPEMAGKQPFRLYAPTTNLEVKNDLQGNLWPLREPIRQTDIDSRCPSMRLSQQYKGQAVQIEQPQAMHYIPGPVPYIKYIQIKQTRMQEREIEEEQGRETNLIDLKSRKLDCHQEKWMHDGDKEWHFTKHNTPLWHTIVQKKNKLRSLNGGGAHDGGAQRS